MKIRIEIVQDIEEDEVIIKCKNVDNQIQKINKAILEITSSERKLIFEKDNIDYYLNLNDILFFETCDNVVNAHTTKDVYKVKYRLYELDEMLSSDFL